jgi:hypothetical protein
LLPPQQLCVPLLLLPLLLRVLPFRLLAPADRPAAAGVRLQLLRAAGLTAQPAGTTSSANMSISCSAAYNPNHVQLPSLWAGNIRVCNVLLLFMQGQLALKKQKQYIWRLPYYRMQNMH